MITRRFAVIAVVVSAAFSGTSAADALPFANPGHAHLPNPCKTFTMTNLRRLLKAPSDAPLQKVHFKTDGHPQCVVDYKTGNFSTTLSQHSLGEPPVGPHTHLYSRPKLGKHGLIDVDQYSTTAIGRTRGIRFSVVVERHLPHKGTRMYHFALAERHRIGHMH
jgi:hypothetical protein